MVSTAQSVLKQKVSITVASGSIFDALQQLEKNYQIRFSYSTDKINIDQKISIYQKNQELKAVLNDLFQGKEISFAEMDGVIILGPVQKRYTISGYIREEGSKELLPGVSIYKPGYYLGSSSNNYGFYSLTLNSDTHLLAFSYIGYEPVYKKIILTKDTELNILLKSSNTFSPVEIQGIKKEEDLLMSSLNLDFNEMTKFPQLLGEKDVLKSTHYLPGVSREHDISNGYNIRGGTPDQNLIILDDASIYNPFHMFGLFSVFNGDALKNLQIIKGGFPARYGGRLSSVVEMSTREGNKENFHAEAAVGLLTTRLNVEGPVIKDKTSFFISARRTHLNELLNRTNATENVRIKYNFYDINTKFNHEFSKNDKIYLSFYKSGDKFNVKNDDVSNGLSMDFLTWGNVSGSFRWNHLYNSKVFANTTFIYSNFDLISLQNDQYFNERISLEFGSGIRDVSFKHDVDYYPNIKHHIKTGIHLIDHRIAPSNSFRHTNDTLETYESHKQNFYGFESAWYAEDEYQVSNRVQLNMGVRLSHFQYKQKAYFNPEPRLSAAWQFDKKRSLKISYARMMQYMHFIGNQFGVGLPNDLWLPATERLKPQTSYQYGLGFIQKANSSFKLSLETYYKKNKRISTFRPGYNFLNFFFNPNESQTNDWEDRLIMGQGESYGTEIQLEKKEGWLSGWVSYSLSYTKWQFDELNNGKAFWASFDRRHSISVYTNIILNKHWSLQSAWIFATGNAITLPSSNYAVLGHEPGDLNPYPGFDQNSVFYFFTEYGERNSYRAAPYHKLDVNMKYQTTIKKSILKIDIGALNVYNRKNPLFYTIVSESNGVNKLKKMAFFGISPSLSFTLSF